MSESLEAQLALVAGKLLRQADELVAAQVRVTITAPSCSSVTGRPSSTSLVVRIGSG